MPILKMINLLQRQERDANPKKKPYEVDGMISFFMDEEFEA